MRILYLPILCYSFISITFYFVSFYNSDTTVAFGYDSMLSVAEFYDGLWLYLFITVSFLFGLLLQFPRPNNYVIFVRRLRLSMSVRVLLFMMIIILLLFILPLSFWNLSSIDGDLSARVFEFKSFRFIAILFIFLISYIIKNSFGFWFIIILTNLYAISDASRFSLFLCILTVVVYRKNISKLAIVVAVFSTILAFGYSRFGLASILDDFILYLGFTISYFTEYSIYSLAYTYTSSKGVFTLSDFFYSIIPLPSQYHFIDVNDRLWRIDQFRPLSGQGSVARISLLLVATYNIVLGWLLGRYFRIVPQNLRMIMGLSALLVFAMSFQYGIRTVTWFLVFLGGTARLASIIRYKKVTL